MFIVLMMIFMLILSGCGGVYSDIPVNEKLVKTSEVKAILKDMQAHSSYELDVYLNGGSQMYPSGLWIDVQDAVVPEQCFYDYIRENAAMIANTVRQNNHCSEIRIFYEYGWFIFESVGFDSAKIIFETRASDYGETPISGEYRGISEIITQVHRFNDISELKCFPDLEKILFRTYGLTDNTSERLPVNEETVMKSVKTAWIYCGEENAFEILEYFPEMDYLIVSGEKNDYYPEIKVDLPQVKTLNIYGCEGFLLSYIEHFPNLEKLIISGSDFVYENKKEYVFPQVKAIIIDSDYTKHFDLNTIKCFPDIEKFCVYYSDDITDEGDRYKGDRKIKKLLPDGCIFERNEMPWIKDDDTAE